MNAPARTTVVFALASGFVVVPTALLLSPYLQWPMAFKLALWADLALYVALLARWGRKGVLSVLFPLALLLGMALWPRTYSGYFFLVVGVLCWIRSGICFQGAPLRTLAAEVITVLAGCALVMTFGGQTSLSWAVGVCLFTLVQALYFFMVPLSRSKATPPVSGDPFKRAFAEAGRLLEGC